MNTVKGSITPLRDNILVVDMDFQEQKTASGIIIQSDDGKGHGVKPRWAKVWAVGPEQKEVSIGEWVYVEHGRWTRKVTIDDGDGVKDFQKVETKSILAVTDERPNDFYIGTEYGHGDTATIRPEDFGAR
jgi:co-chaperonin GroES (HSP10)